MLVHCCQPELRYSQIDYIFFFIEKFENQIRKFSEINILPYGMLGCIRQKQTLTSVRASNQMSSINGQTFVTLISLWNIQKRVYRDRLCITECHRFKNRGVCWCVCCKSLIKFDKGIDETCQIAEYASVYPSPTILSSSLLLSTHAHNVPASSYLIPFDIDLSYNKVCADTKRHNIRQRYLFQNISRELTSFGFVFNNNDLSGE